MKRCPECRRDYLDESLLYCLDDGTRLLEGPVSVDEPATALLHSTAPPVEAATRAQIDITNPTAVLTPTDSTSRKFDKRLLAVPLLAVLLIAGFGAYRYFAPVTSKQIESIAVLPFVNDSGSAEVEYLSDGMTETLINSLSQIPNLNVKARTSVFRYKGKEIDPKKVATELGVQAILIGRVAQRGDQLALSVELIDGATENTIWGSKYDRKTSDLVSLQSEVTRDVSSKLKTKLSGAESAKVEKSYTANPEAYQLYLKGRYSWNRRTSDSLKQAVEFYKQAIEKDPKYALAYSGLAETYSLFSSYSVASSNDSMPQAKAAALRALELDPSLAEPHAALEMYFSYHEHDRAAGEREIRRAIELNPNYATAHQWLGSDVLTPTKRFDEAHASLRRAQELDPLSPIIGVNLADAFLYSRRYDEAIAQYKRTLSLDPNFPVAYFGLSQAYWQKGMNADAIAAIRKYVELSGDPTGSGQLGYFLARSGQREDALKVLSGLKQDSTRRYVQNSAFGLIHIGLGEKEQALEWLEKDVAEHGQSANFFAVSPEYDELRSDPRFKEMLKRLNLPE